MKTREFLLSTYAKLQGLRAARAAYSSQFAPDFNGIGLMSPGELVLSNVLRELLDPLGSHAQGRKFLDLFIRQFELDDLIDNQQVLSVKTEVFTDANPQADRRIDILIEFAGNALGQKLAIAFENKPWASDGVDQIKHYLAHLEVRYLGGYVLIYLSGNEGRLPAAHSITQDALTTARTEKHLLVRCYANLLPWLAACRTHCEAPSVLAFIQSFEQYIRQQFMGIQDMTERKQLVDDAIESKESVEITLELILAQNDIKRSLIVKLGDQLQHGIDKDQRSWRLLDCPDISQATGAFSIQLTKGDQYTVSFGFDQSGGGGFGYGIFKNQQTDDDLPEVRVALDQAYNAKGKKSDWWPWYLDFDQSGRDWRNSSKPWSQIASGEMAKWMIETVAKIEQGLQQEEVVSHLRGNGARE